MFLLKLLKMTFSYFIFQRKLTLKHQKFNFITGSFLALRWKLCYTWTGFGKWRTFKDWIYHLDLETKVTPCYLVIHICTLSFLHSLIQKLPKELSIPLHWFGFLFGWLFFSKSQWFGISYSLWTSIIILKVFQEERFF